MKNFNTVVKSLESLHLKSKVVYVILGLVAVILITLGLGGKKEGFFIVKDAEQTLVGIVDNINNSINSIVVWKSAADKQAFITNINYWWKLKMQYIVLQGGVDLPIYDINKNNKIYQLKASKVGTKDSAGKLLARYVDDTIKTPSQDFLTKYELIALNDPKKQYITKGGIKWLYTQIHKKIDTFAQPDPNGMVSLKNAYAMLDSYANQFGEFMLKEPIIKVDSQFYNNILGKGTKPAVPVEPEAPVEIPAARVRRNSQYKKQGQDICSNGSMTNIPIQCINSIYEDAQCSAAELPFNRPTTIPVEGFPYDMFLSNSSLDISEIPNMNWASFQRTVLPKVVSQVCGDQQDDWRRDPIYETESIEREEERIKRARAMARARIERERRMRGTGYGPAIITQSNIPPGREDLYMLKTQVLPTNPPGSAYSSPRSTTNASPMSTTNASPPASTNPGLMGSTNPGLMGSTNPGPSTGCNKPSPVPPCPPCERCPEPAFDCKRVPNYNSQAINQYIPQPVLADFSQFGM
jgi:hypothetical protein